MATLTVRTRPSAEGKVSVTRPSCHKFRGELSSTKKDHIIDLKVPDRTNPFLTKL